MYLDTKYFFLPHVILFLLEIIQKIYFQIQ